MSDEPDYTEILRDTLGRFQHNVWVRRLVGVFMIAAMLAVSGYFVYDLLPRRHHLTITGGEIIGNRHYLAKVLEEEARSAGISLKIVPTHGSIEALEKLESGELDLALSQGGLDPSFRDIVHVATIAPEVIHFIVRPGIESVADLRGKVINLGSLSGGTRVVAQSILRTSGLEDGMDYTETHYSGDRLITMRPEQLPDVIVNVSFQPAFIAEYLVQERGYRILEIPFPGSLALRMGWVADANILAYTYGVTPPVPDRDIKTVGVNLHLLANARVPDRTINALLDVLYSPSVMNRLRVPLDEANILLPSGYPLSPGTVAFLARNEPLLSAERMEDLKAAAGLAFSLISGLLITVRWFRGKPIQEEFHDGELKARIAEVGSIERWLLGITPTGPELRDLDHKLAELRTEVLEGMETFRLQDPTLVPTFLAAEAAARSRLALMRVPR